MILMLLIAGCGFAQTAEEVALKLESTLRSYETFQADFEQFYYSSTITTPLHEKGKVYFKKPTLIWAIKRAHFLSPKSSAAKSCLFQSIRK